MIRRLSCFSACVVFGSLALAQVPPVPKNEGASTGPQPKLHVAQRLLNLGKIADGDRPVVSWTLENRGDADLVIEKTQTSCGCTVVQLAEDQKRIPPGGVLELKASFDSKGRRGYQHKKIGVITNDPAEPKIDVEFDVTVEPLYEIDPPGMLNLRAVQRGEEVEKMILVWPAAGRKELEIKSFEFDNSQVPLTHTIEPFTRPEGVGGQRIRFRVSDAASLGPLTTTATLKLSVDGIERMWPIPIRADVISELTWTPVVLDASRQVLVAGRQLAPINIRSSEKVTFEITDIAAGPYLEPKYEVLSEPPARTAVSVYLTVTKDAPPGPFAANVKIETNSLDQPLIEVPVFGIITPPLQADPPIIRLRADGTPAGEERRVKLQADPTAKLTVAGVTCDNPEVHVIVDDSMQRLPAHVAFIKAQLKNGKGANGNEGLHGKPSGDGSTSPGRRVERAMVRVTTNIPGHESFEIPIVIEQ